MCGVIVPIGSDTVYKNANDQASVLVLFVCCGFTYSPVRQASKLAILGRVGGWVCSTPQAKCNIKKLVVANAAD